MKLQELDASLESLLQSKSDVVPRRDKVKADIQALSTQFDEAKKALTQAQVSKKNLELDIDTKDQAVRKASGELNSVKSNEAYKGLLTQMEEAKKAKTELEDKVLEIMEKMEGLQKDLKEREKQLQQNKGALEKQVADLDAEEQRLQAEWEAKKAERDQFAGTLPADSRDRYEQVHRGRRGFAVLVPVLNMYCGGCRTTLPANVVNQVMKGKEVISCDSCSRILYIPPAEPAATQPQ